MLNCMGRNLYKNFRTLATLKERINLKNIDTNMAENFNIRWAFNVRTWKPTDDEILAASSFIQTEEKERISRYVFQDDAKSSLIGRLLLRKYIHISTSIPYEEIRLGRDDRGKPYLMGTGGLPISFNVSHQGDFVVLAGDSQRNIGVDVMKIEPPVNKNIPEFFRLMRRQFSRHEWVTIRSFPTEAEQIACFYRFWCLKESYVKNIGFGITVPLDEISFSIQTRKLKVGEMIADTVLYVRNVLKDEWVFEETLLDNRHTVAVAMATRKGTDYGPTSYGFLSFDDLVREAKPLFETDRSFKDNFIKKQMKNI